MALLERAPSSASTQRAKRPNAGKATIPAPASHSVRKRRNNPFGIVPARIARVEKWLELLCALDDCANLERRSGRAIGYCARTREAIEAKLLRGDLSLENYHRNSLALDRVETRIAINLIAHADHVCTRSIPECRAVAAQAERAA